MDAPKLTVQADREEDGRWIAEVLGLPGVMVYGPTREQAWPRPRRLPYKCSSIGSSAASG
jgi:hypothetical protein